MLFPVKEVENVQVLAAILACKVGLYQLLIWDYTWVSNTKLRKYEWGS